MIYETKEISSELLSGLKPNNYTRRIKSHFAAYGTGYDFLHFYAVEESGEKLGIISVFNASMMISTFKDKRFDDKVLGELAGMDDLIGPPVAEPGSDEIMTDHEQDDGVGSPEKSVCFHISSSTCHERIRTAIAAISA